MQNLIDKDALMSELTAWSLEQYPKRGDKIQFYKHRGIAETMQKVWSFPETEVPRWIPVTKRLPEEPFGCLVTVWDNNLMTGEEFENLLPYFVGWDGEQWNDDDGEQCPFEVIAWCRLPEPYRKETEDE